MSGEHELSGTELANRFRRGELSPVEALRALLARIDAWAGCLQFLLADHA